MNFFLSISYYLVISLIFCASQMQNMVWNSIALLVKLLIQLKQTNNKILKITPQSFYLLVISLTYHL